eukprot:799887-Amorphochlora_amoeboformis.AAC.2
MALVTPTWLNARRTVLSSSATSPSNTRRGTAYHFAFSTWEVFIHPFFSLCSPLFLSNSPTLSEVNAGFFYSTAEEREKQVYEKKKSPQ